MPESCREGDRTFGICDDGHRCCPHSRGGKCMQGSADVFINGRGAMRRGDKGKTRCPHNAEFELKGGSSTVFINGRNAIRIGDAACCAKCEQAGMVESGSRDVLIGG